MNIFTSYERTIGDHYVQGLVGFTQELSDNLSILGSNDVLQTDELPMLRLSDGTSRSASDDASQLAIRGTFARVNYNYKGKYLLEFNGRFDGTSRFLKEVRNKFYPGFSAAWVPSSETFWLPIEPYVNRMKLRFSYGSLGDQVFLNNNYPFFPSLGRSLPTGTNYIFSDGRQSQFGPPPLVDMTLTWVTTTTINYGVDLHTLNNQLSFSFDWYKRSSKDFAGPPTMFPVLLGVAAPQVNNAEIETTGFEITLGWRDKIGEVTYGVNAVLGDQKGKVVKYNNTQKLLAQVWYDGMTLGEIWGFETVGLFQSEDEIRDAPGQNELGSANWFKGDVRYKKIADDGGDITYAENSADNPGDRRIIGNNSARYTFGLNLTSEWKGFDLTVFLQGVGKRDMMFGTGANYFWGYTGDQWQSSYFTVHRDRWTEDNTGGYFPRHSFESVAKNRVAQTRYLQNAAYLRIKNVQAGYTIPRSISERVNIQRARIFVNVENLATFTGLMKIIDPEIVDAEAKVYPLRKRTP